MVFDLQRQEQSVLFRTRREYGTPPVLTTFKVLFTNVVCEGMARDVCVSTPASRDENNQTGVHVKEKDVDCASLWVALE